VQAASAMSYRYQTTQNFFATKIAKVLPLILCL
jgi:hypothetical protein